MGSCGQDMGGLGHLGGGLEFTLGVDHLAPPFPLRLGLLGHGPLHLDGQVDGPQFHQGHLDAPGIGMFVQDLRQLGVDFLPLAESKSSRSTWPQTLRRVVWASNWVAFQ